MDITIKTVSTDNRNVTLWLNKDSSVSLLGGLAHGTKIIIDQKLVNDLQKMVNQIEELTEESQNEL